MRERVCGAAMVAMALLAASCAGAPPPADPSREDPVETRASPPEDSRALGAGATFGDLVAAAQRTAERGDADGSDGCLLAGGGPGQPPTRLTADLAIPMRPLPPAPGDLGRRLERHRGSVSALSVWGRQGTADELVLVTVTSLPPRPLPVFAAFLSADGVSVRPLGAVPPPAGTTGPIPPASLRESLAAARLEGPVLVTADAGVSVVAVRDLLLRLGDAGLVVGLAVVLPEGTRLPDAPAAAAPSDGGLCPDGLPAPPEGAAEGDLPVAALHAGLESMPGIVTRCIAGAPAVSGSFELSLRVGPDGAVVHACASADTVGEPAVRACILEGARALRFSAPDPTGFVDLALPLRLALDASTAERPVCP